MWLGYFCSAKGQREFQIHAGLFKRAMRPVAEWRSDAIQPAGSRTRPASREHLSCRAAVKPRPSRHVPRAAPARHAARSAGAGLLPLLQGFFFELAGVEVVVEAALLQQLARGCPARRSCRRRTTRIDVRLADGGQAVGNEEGRAARAAAWSMASWISCSVWVSMEEVASSSTKMRGSASTARAKEISCFSPVESRSPPSPTSLS